MPPTSAPPAPVSSPTLLTADEFTARYENVHAELVRGVVKEYPVPWPRHGHICATMSGFLWLHVRAGDLGRIMSNDSWIQTGSDPVTIRGGDVLFFSYERLPRGPLPDGILPVAPELVVEVRSPSGLWTELFAKVGEYLKAGVSVVVILEPKKATASVYRNDGSQQIFQSGDTLALPDVLPGFSVRVSDLFA